MKVLEKGNGQKGWAKELKCTAHRNGETGCGAKLLVEEGDIRYTGSKHSYGDNYPTHYYGFVCPECGQITDVDNLPSLITNKITKKVTKEVKQKLGW